MTDRQQDQNRQDQYRQPQQDQLGRQGQQQGGQNPGQLGSAQDQGRQQQQFDAEGSGGQQGGGAQSGGIGSDSRFADRIREHQEVVDAQGNHVGTVDHVQGDQIKLARSDSSDGQHHYVQLSQVAGIEGDKVRLRERGDNDFGQQAE